MTPHEAWQHARELAAQAERRDTEQREAMTRGMLPNVPWEVLLRVEQRMEATP